MIRISEGCSVDPPMKTTAADFAPVSTISRTFEYGSGSIGSDPHPDEALPQTSMMAVVVTTVVAE